MDYMSSKFLAIVAAVFVVGGLAGYTVKGKYTSSPSMTQSTTPTLSETGAQPGTTEWKIQDALSAAPESVAKGATVLDFPEKEGGDLVELQKGTNDWTCLTDYPASPGKDPMCVDKQGMLWLQDYVTQKPPTITQTGIAYMLQGGSDASNTDPFATEPTEGDDWITTPAHVMVFPVGKLDPNAYGTDPKKGGSWIMWAGTPYEHLMIPVK
jgi:hypothetical protein